MYERVDLARAVQHLRGARTQLQVAQKAGVSSSHWNQIERGKRRPGRDVFKRIAVGLGVSTEELEEQVWRARGRRLAADRRDESSEAAGLLGSEIAERGHYDAGPPASSDRTRHHLDQLFLHLSGLIDSLSKPASYSEPSDHR